MSIEYRRIIEWRDMHHATAKTNPVEDLRKAAVENVEICDLALRHIEQMMNRNEWTQQRLARQEMAWCRTCGWPIPCKCGPT